METCLVILHEAFGMPSTEINSHPPRHADILLPPMWGIGIGTRRRFITAYPSMEEIFAEIS